MSTDDLPTDIELARAWRDEHADPVERHRTMPANMAYVWGLVDALLGDHDRRSAADDLDLQERAGLVAVWLAPAADGQEPVVSLELEGAQKRYARVWLRSPDRVEWGWTLADTAVCLWREPEP